MTRALAEAESLRIERAYFGVLSPLGKQNVLRHKSLESQQELVENGSYYTLSSCADESNAALEFDDMVESTTDDKSINQDRRTNSRKITKRLRRMAGKAFSFIGLNLNIPGNIYYVPKPSKI